MRDRLKRKDDDMLIVHKPPPVGKTGREPTAAEMEALPSDLDALVAILSASADTETRRALLAAIQGRFGNAVATRVAERAQRPSPVAPAEDGGNR